MNSYEESQVKWIERHRRKKRQVMYKVNKTFLNLTAQEWLVIGGNALLAAVQIVLISVGKENPAYAPAVQTILLLIGKIAF